LKGILLAFLFAACSPPAPDEAGFSQAAATADLVIESNLVRSVATLATDHATDERVDCTGFSPASKFPACELSRDAALAYVTRALTEFGYEPRVEPLGYGPTAFNLVAERRGEQHPDEVVLVAAHLDAFFSGADDNSSGVSALLEIARVASTLRFSRSLRFVAFDLEEYGAAGSARYVEAGLAGDVVLALVLECLGYASSERGSQDGLPGLSLGETGDFLMVVANGDSREQAQRLLALNHDYGFVHMKGIAAGGSAWFPLTSALTRSDNGPFWLARIPALMLTDTADLRNPNYHSAADTPETLDPKFLTGSTRAALAGAALFAGVLP
jgi:hypothetical protein